MTGPVLRNRNLFRCVFQARPDLQAEANHWPAAPQLIELPANRFTDFMSVLRLIHHLLEKQRNFCLDVLECHPDPLGFTGIEKRPFQSIFFRSMTIVYHAKDGERKR